MRLFVDWDGTVTVQDSLVQVIERFGDVGVYEETEERLGRDLTLHEVIALEVATIRAPLDEVVEWVLENVDVRPGLAELAALRPVIVSAGFHELIEPVLRREGIELDVLANEVEARPDGWVVRFRDEAACATCGEPCKRAGDAGARYAYVGDGYSDRCAAVAADRVFARDSLATHLDEVGVAYEPFDDLREVAALLRGT